MGPVPRPPLPRPHRRPVRPHGASATATTRRSSPGRSATRAARAPATTRPPRGSAGRPHPSPALRGRLHARLRGRRGAGHRRRHQRITDLICPMYPTIDQLVRWSEWPLDDRPLIMCEYSHAMGNSNGSLADYWAAIEAHPGPPGRVHLGVGRPHHPHPRRRGAGGVRLRRDVRRRAQRRRLLRRRPGGLGPDAPPGDARGEADRLTHPGLGLRSPHQAGDAREPAVVHRPHRLPGPMGGDRRRRAGRPRHRRPRRREHPGALRAARPHRRRRRDPPDPPVRPTAGDRVGTGRTRGRLGPGRGGRTGPSAPPPPAGPGPGARLVRGRRGRARRGRRDPTDPRPPPGHAGRGRRTATPTSSSPGPRCRCGGPPPRTTA